MFSLSGSHLHFSEHVAITCSCRFNHILEVEKSGKIFHKVPVRGAYFQVKLRFEVHHLDFIPENKI